MNNIATAELHESKPLSEALVIRLEGTEELPLDGIRITLMCDENHYGWVEEEGHWREQTPDEMDPYSYELQDGVFTPPASADAVAVGSRFKIRVDVPPLPLLEEAQQNLRRNVNLGEIFNQIKASYGSKWDALEQPSEYRDAIISSLVAFVSYKGISVEDISTLEEQLSLFSFEEFHNYAMTPVESSEHRRALNTIMFCYERCLNVVMKKFPIAESRQAKVQKILDAAQISIGSSTPISLERDGMAVDASTYWCVFDTQKTGYEPGYGPYNVRSE